MTRSSSKKMLFVLVLLLFSFGLVASTSITSLVCPVPPSGEGEGEVVPEGEAEPEPEPQPEEALPEEGEGEVVPPADGEVEEVIEEAIAEGEGEEVIEEAVAEGEGEEGAGLSDLSVTPGSLLLEAATSSGTVDVTNAGSGTLNWTATCTNVDVTITPSEGSGPATVTIEGTANAFAKDDVSATVTFTNADNPTDTANVSVSLLGRGVSTGLKNVPLGTTVYLVGKADHEYTTIKVEGVSPKSLTTGLPDVTDPSVSAYKWEITSAPASFAADLSSTTDARVTLVPDVVGQYTLQCTMTQDGTDYAYAETINVSTFVGIENCSMCHNGNIAEDKVTPWSETKHAHMFEEGVDGIASDHYGSNCLRCHTVGNDRHASADNGGFDDVMTDTGWVFPSVLQAGNYDAVPADLKNVANIQCENCHGPGGDHNGNTDKIGVSLDAGVCSICHDAGTHHIFPTQWRESGHSDENAGAFSESHMNTNTSCVRCHSGAAYVAKVKGVADADLPLGEQTVTCSVCHDPHDATNPHQLRRYGEVDLPPYETDTGGAGINNFDNVGAGATCMYCHNARRGPASARSTRFPHESTAADMLMGINGVEYGAFAANSSHTTATANDGYCVKCHMAATPGDGEPGQNLVGAHTFAMSHVDDNGTPDDPSDDTEVENIGACTECHPDLTEFNREASGDWDGNGSTEGVKDEVAGLMDLLLEQILAKGAVQLDAYPGWDLAAVTAEDLPKVQDAIWNYTFVEMDRSEGIHNTNYTVTLLQRSYKDLAGVDVPGADIR